MYAARKLAETDRHHGETDNELMVWKRQQCAAIDRATAFDKHVIREDTGIDKESHQINYTQWSYYTQYVLLSSNRCSGLSNYNLIITGRIGLKLRNESVSARSVVKHVFPRQPFSRRCAPPAARMSPGPTFPHRNLKNPGVCRAYAGLARKSRL